jgi:ABC-type phosphate transport system permease subunit
MQMTRGWTGCVTQLINGAYPTIISGVFSGRCAARMLGAGAGIETAALFAGTLVGGLLALGACVMAGAYALQRVPHLNED